MDYLQEDLDDLLLLSPSGDLLLVDEADIHRGQSYTCCPCRGPLCGGPFGSIRPLPPTVTFEVDLMVGAAHFAGLIRGRLASTDYVCDTVLLSVNTFPASIHEARGVMALSIAICRNVYPVVCGDPFDGSQPAPTNVWNFQAWFGVGGILRQSGGSWPAVSCLGGWAGDNFATTLGDGAIGTATSCFSKFYLGSPAPVGTITIVG